MCTGGGGYVLRAWNFDVVDARTYANVRAELHGKLKAWLPGGAIEDNSELAEDITAADFWFNRQGQIQIEAKDSIRARLGRSPDRSDALALTFAVEPAIVIPDDDGLAHDQLMRRAAQLYERTGHLPDELEFDPYANIR